MDFNKKSTFDLMFNNNCAKMYGTMLSVCIKHFYKRTLMWLVMSCVLLLIILEVTNWKIYSKTNIHPAYANIRSFGDPSIAVTLLNKYRTKNGHFQPVSNGNTTYVYSAYLEKSADKIRVVGVTDSRNTSISCVLWYINRKIDYSPLVTGYIVKINEGHYKQYTASYIICYLLGNEVPDAVSIVENITDKEPTNILPVRRPEVLKEKHNFSVCLSPIQGNYGNTKELIEWLELIQLLGVTRVVVYVHNATNDVMSVLKSYEANNLVRLSPWVLPEKLYEGALHYCGQLAALNDCILRNKGQSRYVSAFDLDEMIIPQEDEDFTWVDMLERVTKESVYIFRNSFFFQSENTSKVHKSNQGVGLLKIMSHQLKDDFIYGPRDRSKWIIDPDKVATMGIHNAWAIKNGLEYTVPTDIGLLHHYRENGVKYPEGIHVTRKKHRTAEKYHHQLEQGVAHMFKKLKINFLPES